MLRAIGKRVFFSSLLGRLGKPFVHFFLEGEQFLDARALLHALEVRRHVIKAGGSYALREPTEPYGSKFTDQIEALRTQNTYFWDKSDDEART